MGHLPPWGVLLLGGLGVLLLAAGRCGSSSPHSSRYFYMEVSEPGQGLPQFITVGHVNELLFVKYDGDGNKLLPQFPGMEEVGNGTGLRTLQRTCGCEVGLEGRPRGGHYQYAYDGEDFIAPDGMLPASTRPTRTTTLTPQALGIATSIWPTGMTARTPQAPEILVSTRSMSPTMPTARVSQASEIPASTRPLKVTTRWPLPLESKRRREAGTPEAQSFNPYLEGEREARLRKYLDYGKGTLMRTASNSGLVLGIVGFLLAVVILAGAGVAFYIKKQKEKSYEAASSLSRALLIVSIPEA